MTFLLVIELDKTDNQLKKDSDYIQSALLVCNVQLNENNEITSKSHTPMDPQCYSTVCAFLWGKRPELYMNIIQMVYTCFDFLVCSSVELESVNINEFG